MELKTKHKQGYNKQIGSATFDTDPIKGLSKGIKVSTLCANEKPSNFTRLDTQGRKAQEIFSSWQKPENNDSMVKKFAKKETANFSNEVPTDLMNNMRTVSNITAKFGAGRDIDERIRDGPDDAKYRLSFYKKQKTMKKSNNVTMSRSSSDSSELERDQENEIGYEISDRREQGEGANSIKTKQASFTDHDIEEEKRDKVVDTAINAIRPPTKDVRVQRKPTGAKRVIKLKRQVTLNEHKKTKTALVDPAKKLSFASMQNSSFNLSFKDLNAESRKQKQSKENTIHTSQTKSSEWLEVVEKHNNSFGNTMNILGRLSSMPLAKNATCTSNLLQFAKCLIPKPKTNKKTRIAAMCTTKSNPFEYKRIDTAKLPQSLRRQSESMKMMNESKISTNFNSSFKSPLRKINVENILPIKKHHSNDCEIDPGIKRALAHYNKKRLSMIKNEDAQLSKNITVLQKHKSTPADREVAVPVTHKSSKRMAMKMNKRKISSLRIHNISEKSRMGDMKEDVSDRGFNDDMDDQTVIISMMDTTSMYGGGQPKPPNLIKGLSKCTNPGMVGYESEMMSPMDTSPIQTPLRDVQNRESSFKAMYDISRRELDLDARMDRSPMTATNKLNQFNYTFKRQAEQEKKVEQNSISDFESDKDMSSPIRGDKEKPLSFLTPTTPQNKAKIVNVPLVSQSALQVNARRKSDTNSALSNQNIFSRRQSRGGLTRQDSIFTHASGVTRIQDPATGKDQVNQYILVKPIGKGSFAEVLLGYNIIDKQKCAVKVVQLTKLRRILTSKNKTGVDSLKTEIVIMKKLNHKHLVKLNEVLGDPEGDKIYLVTEYMKNGSLASMMNKANLTMEKIWTYFRHIIIGIEYCHSVANICHRDIKPENMLIGDNGDLKISDFGVSSIIENGNDCLQNTAGSNYYFSPELSKGSTYKGKGSDIWAIGVTLYQMVYKKYPFEGRTFPELYNRIQNTEPNYAEDTDPDLITLFKGILDKDPEKRFTIAEIRSNDWVTKKGSEPIEEVDEIQEINLCQNDYDKAFGKISVTKQRKIKFARK